MRIKLMSLATLSLLMIATPVFASELSFVNDTSDFLQLEGKTDKNPSKPTFTTDPIEEGGTSEIEFDYPASGTLTVTITKITIPKKDNKPLSVYSNSADGICELSISKSTVNPTISIYFEKDTTSGQTVPVCVLKDEVTRSPSAG